MSNVNLPTPEKRISDYEALAYGMFVHWGLYSQIEKGEWIYWMTDRNMDKYQHLAETFTAEDFDARALVETAKKAGCKYITFTTRHHEGFSLYDTRGLCDFDSVHFCNRDFVQEFCDACNEFGIVPFLYHTTWDWYQKSFDEDFDTYLEYLRQSVEILCKYYGKIGGFFFDGNWIKPHGDWKLDDLYGTIRKYQPDAIIINNTGMGRRGERIHKDIDVVTFEQGNVHPIDRDGVPKYCAAEVCLTMNKHWGIAKNDLNYKSPAELIYELCNARCCGTNFLLNVSPTASGALIPYQTATLDIIGSWLSVFGEAIYDSEMLVYPDGVSSIANVKILKSRTQNAYYIFDFVLGEIGDKNVTVGSGYSGIVGFSNVKAKIEKIEWMDSKESLEFTQGKDNSLNVNLTGYKYGTDFCVRVAKAYLK